MASLTTKYLGLQLENPIVVSSSGLADSVDKVMKLSDHGAGAVVLKSLFEEQINHEASSMIGDHSYPEATDYIRNYTKDHSVDEYLSLISGCKKSTQIPIMASINCISNTDWYDFATKIEEAGADALELNMFILPVDGSSPERLEEIYFSIIAGVRAKTRIPVVVKISPYFSNLLYMIDRFYALGAGGVVLFNRLYEPDININNLKSTSSEVFSHPNDLRQVLRWVSLASDKSKAIQIAASTGVHSGEAAIKLLLAGAQVVQVCSVLYKNGLSHLLKITGDIGKWMDSNNYSTIADFRGIMNYRNFDNPNVWDRAQFMKYFSSRN